MLNVKGMPMKSCLCLIMLLSIVVFSCKKGPYDPFNFGRGVKANFNDDYVILESVSAANFIDCDFVSFCPYPVGGQPAYDLCILRYKSTVLSYTEKWTFTIYYQVVVDTSLLTAGFNPIHKQQDLIWAFDPAEVNFAKNNSEVGVIVEVLNQNNMVRYSTLSYPHDSILNDSRFLFRFTQPPADAITNNQYTRDHTYEILSHGVFNCVVYSPDGDSLVITDGEFKMLFCE